MIDGHDDRGAMFARLRQDQPEEHMAQATNLREEPIITDAANVAADAIVYDSFPDDVPLLLRYPFSIGTLRVSQIRLRSPTFSDVEAVMRGEISELEMHARMAELPLAALKALRWADAEIVTFLARSLAPELKGR